MAGCLHTAKGLRAQHSSPCLCSGMARVRVWNAGAQVHLLLTHKRTRSMIDLNGEALRCRRSGFLPVHAAVASGDGAMYEYLVVLPGVPGRLGCMANPSAKTRPKNIHEHKLTALQLAFWRGDAKLVQFIIEQRCRFQWRWGPLSSIMFSLSEIDSSGEGGNDLMELMLMADAPQACQPYLLTAPARRSRPSGHQCAFTACRAPSPPLLRTS